MLVPALISICLSLDVDIQVIVGAPVNIGLDPVEETPLTRTRGVAKIGKPEVPYPFAPEQAVHADLVPVKRGFGGFDNGQELTDRPAHIAIGLIFPPLPLQN